MKIALETSDFVVERSDEDRVTVYVYGADHDVELDLHPGVLVDLVAALLSPEDP